MAGRAGSTRRGVGGWRGRELVGAGRPEPSTWDELPAHLRVRYLQAPAHPDSPGPLVADRSALAFCEHAGFIDAGTATGDRTQTVPPPGYLDAEFVPFRCDHLLLSAQAAAGLTSYQVIADELTATASDHLPIVCEIEPR